MQVATILQEVADTPPWAYTYRERPDDLIEIRETELQTILEAHRPTPTPHAECVQCGNHIDDRFVFCSDRCADLKLGPSNTLNLLDRARGELEAMHSTYYSRCTTGGCPTRQLIDEITAALIP